MSAADRARGPVARAWMRHVSVKVPRAKMRDHLGGFFVLFFSFPFLFFSFDSPSHERLCLLFDLQGQFSGGREDEGHRGIPSFCRADGPSLHPVGRALDDGQEKRCR